MKKLRLKKFVTTNLTPKKVTIFLLGTAAAAFFALIYSLIVLVYSGAALLLHRQEEVVWAFVFAFVVVRPSYYLLKKTGFRWPWLSFPAVSIVLLVCLPLFQIPFTYPGPTILHVSQHSRTSQVDITNKARLSNRRVKLDFEVRDALILLENHSITKRINVPPQAQFCFGVGTEKSDSPPFHLAVFIKSPDSYSPEKVFSKIISRDESRWEDVAVDLSAHAGKNRTISIQLTSTTKDSTGGKAYISPPKINCPGEAARTAGMPNIVLIVVDSLRYDHMNTYGYDIRETDPVIYDMWKKQGVRFDNAYSTSSWTAPSVASIMTSLYISEHGVGLENFTYARLRDRFKTMPELLSQRGYETAAFSLSFVVSPQFNYQQGSDVFFDLAFFQFYWNGDMKAAHKARKWFGKDRTRPFFAYFHLMNPHYPFSSGPFVYDESISKMKIYATENYIRSHLTNFYDIWRFPEPPFEKDELQENRMLKDYDGEIKRTSNALKEIFFELENRGLMKNTLIIITADHGEEFNDHGKFYHGKNLYQETNRVPLIVAGEMIKEPGRKIECPVSLIDIMPTVLKSAGVPRPYNIRGKSLWPIIKKKSCYHRSLMAELYNPFEPDGIQKAVIKDNMKLLKIKKKGQDIYQLFDTRKDRLERHDLASKRPELIKEMRPPLHDLRRERVATRQMMQETKIHKSYKEKLKALGYVQ